MNECPECGSEKIVKKALLIEQGENYMERSPQIVVFEKPDAMLFRGKTRSSVRAEICGDCGFIQTYATEPRKLWTAYQTSISDIE